MSVFIQQKPASIVWGDVNFYFAFNFSGLAAGDKIFAEFRHATNFSTLATTSYLVKSSFGLWVLEDINQMLRPYVKGSKPVNTASGTAAVITECSTDHVMPFYCKYWVLKANGSTQDHGDTMGTPNYLLKGGIADMVPTKEHNINMGTYSRPAFLPNGLPFLTYVPQERYMTPEECGWLLFLNDANDVPKVTYTVHYANGTSTPFIRTFQSAAGPNYRWRTWQIPIGIKQCNLDPTNKGIWFYTVKVTTGTTSYPEYKLRPDYRPFSKGLQLYYRNSMGAMDHIFLHGVVQRNGGSFEKKEFTMNKRFATNGAKQYYDSSATLKFKANTGFIRPEHKTVLFDLFHTDYAAVLLDGEWLPMRVPAQDMPPVASSDNLHSYSIEFEAGPFKSIPKQLVKLLSADGNIAI